MINKHDKTANTVNFSKKTDQNFDSYREYKKYVFSSREWVISMDFQTTKNKKKNTSKNESISSKSS